MTARKFEIVEAIQNGIDPFAFFRPKHDEIDFQGWHSEHHFLSSVVEELKPQTIVEVGVWKGGSVITMAKKIQSLHLNSAIIAVDTWRGSPEHWCQPVLWELMNVKNGIPGLDETFMANIMSKSLQEFLVPLPVDSMFACEILKRKGIHPELIHIDAGHEYDSVMTDLRIWSGGLRCRARLPR